MSDAGEGPILVGVFYLDDRAEVVNKNSCGEGASP
jgi:hypothetical protein